VTPFWKYKSLRPLSIGDALPFILAYFTLELLAYLLDTKPPHPLDLDAGWKPFLAWVVIYIAFLVLYTRIYSIFRRVNNISDKPSPSFQRNSDNYQLAKSEIEAENVVKRKGDACPTIGRTPEEPVKNSE